MPTVRRLLRLLLLVAAVVVLLEGVERLARYWVERHLEVEAAWIWDPDWPQRPVRAHAFQAVAAISLGHDAPDARLLVIADEEYLVHLDGTWVGAGRYREDATWHAYPVGRLLGAGDHELSVTLRSERGVGGLLLCLELEPGQGCALRSDDTWRVFHDFRTAGESDGEEGQPALVWGPAHVGRWKAPRAVEERPLFADCVDDRRAFDMLALVDRGTEPMRRDDGSLVEVKVQRVRWRYRMAGFFSLELAQPAERQVAVLTPIPRAGPAQAEDLRVVMVTQPGQEWWTPVDAHVLRSLDVLGEVEIAGAIVHPMVEECRELMAVERPSPRGLLGRSPVRESPVEHELRTAR